MNGLNLRDSQDKDSMRGKESKSDKYVAVFVRLGMVIWALPVATAVLMCLFGSPGAPFKEVDWDDKTFAAGTAVICAIPVVLHFVWRTDFARSVTFGLMALIVSAGVFIFGLAISEFELKTGPTYLQVVSLMVVLLGGLGFQLYKTGIALDNQLSSERRIERERVELADGINAAAESRRAQAIDEIVSRIVADPSVGRESGGRTILKLGRVEVSIAPQRHR